MWMGERGWGGRLENSCLFVNEFDGVLKLLPQNSLPRLLLCDLQEAQHHNRVPVAPKEALHGQCRLSRGLELNVQIRGHLGNLVASHCSAIVGIQRPAIVQPMYDRLIW